MIWKIEEAQQQFPEIIDASGATPQLIYERDRLVVAVIRADLFQEFLTWQQKQQPISLVEALEELHQICLEENYTFEIPQRSDRPNPFMETLLPLKSLNLQVNYVEVLEVKESRDHKQIYSPRLLLKFIN